MWLRWARGAHLGVFHATILFDPTMIVFDGPAITGETDSGQRRHAQIVCGPVCLVRRLGQRSGADGSNHSLSDERGRLGSPFQPKLPGVIPSGRD